MVKSIVVEVILGARVVEVDLFTAPEFTFLLVESIVHGEVAPEIVNVLLGLQDSSSGAFSFGLVEPELAVAVGNHDIPSPESVILTYSERKKIRLRSIM